MADEERQECLALGQWRDTGPARILGTPDNV
jgi:hypothetical protein